MFGLTQTITAADLRSHHINHRPYATDMEYVMVARNLYKVIKSLIHDRYVTPVVAKDLAIRLTLHLEDTVADAGVWRGFCTGHHRLYGRWLPFLWNNDDIALDVITPESCTFIVWMTFTNHDSLRYVSPLMPAISTLGKEMFRYLNGLFDDMTINEELTDDISSKLVLDDFYKMRDVLTWLCDPNGCYMSYWDVTMEGMAQEYKAAQQHLSQEKHITYQVRSVFPFKEKVGPLAILAQEWYADMLHGNADSNIRRYAEVVRRMEFKRFDTYKIEKIKDNVFTLRGVDDKQIQILSAELGINPENMKEDTNMLISSFVFYNGKWESTGITALQHSGKEFKDVIKTHHDSVDNREREKEIYQRFIDKNKGQRIYYFRNFKEFTNWHDGIFMAEVSGKLFETFPKEMKQSNQLLVYLPTDGGLEIAVDVCAPLHDKNNPFYGEKEAKDIGISYLDMDCLRGECLRYMINSGMLRYLSFPGGDPEHSNKTAQENIDFLLRYYKRGLY